MVLIVGGTYQGQREEALRRFTQDEIYFDLHLKLKDALAQDESIQAVIDEALRHACVTCDEVGSGIVPMARADRLWRETVGRTCQTLAAAAHQVIRVQCGLAQVIKG